MLSWGEPKGGMSTDIDFTSSQDHDDDRGHCISEYAIRGVEDEQVDDGGYLSGPEFISRQENDWLVLFNPAEHDFYFYSANDSAEN